jgi:hypothetical protein
MQLYKIQNYKKEDEKNVMDFAAKITLDHLNNCNDSNKILCRFSKTLTPYETNPKMIFINLNRIYSLEFISGTENVFLHELEFESNRNMNINQYLENLISDPDKVWKTTSLTYETELSNQLLTLLRICKVDKDEYVKNPNALSMKFKKK